MYTVEENNGRFKYELRWLVMKNDQPVASHNVKETSAIHAEKNNRVFPGNEQLKNKLKKTLTNTHYKNLIKTLKI